MANEEHVRLLLQGVEAFYQLQRDDPVAAKDLNRIGDLFDEAIQNWNKRRRWTTNREADLSNIDLHGPNETGLFLWGAELRSVDFSNSNLGGALLMKADLSHAKLIGTDLSNVCLSDANLSFADLSGACLRKADLMKTNFLGATLRGTDFTDAELGWTIFAGTDLSEAKGLEHFIYAGPGFIDIETIRRSGGKIPESLLRDCGVPDTFITYARSLIGKAIDFFSCFISFTEADDAFSVRLHHDLQAAGVRCWRWKEDAKWGKTLMRSIDEAVRVYDKLVVICSEQSLKSPAVIREIERALQKEDDLARQGKDNEVLFPIRLDDHIFSGWQHHRKADVLAKNVGDFRDWQDAANYPKKLDRLIRDLKAEA